MKEIVVNPLHCKIPIPLSLPSGKWLNLSFDILSFASDLFKNQTFRSIDSISVTGNCRIRKVFTMKNAIQEVGNLNEIKPQFLTNIMNNNDIDQEMLNKILNFQSEITYENINLNYDKVKAYISSNNNDYMSSPQIKCKNSLLNNNFIDGNIISPYLKQTIASKNTPTKENIEKNINIKSNNNVNRNAPITKNKITKNFKKIDQFNNNLNEINIIKSKSKSPDKNLGPLTKKSLIINKQINQNSNNTLNNNNSCLKIPNPLKTTIMNNNNITQVDNHNEKYDLIKNNQIKEDTILAVKYNAYTGTEIIDNENNCNDQNEEERYEFDEKDFSSNNSVETKKVKNNKLNKIQNNINVIEKEDNIVEYQS